MAWQGVVQRGLEGRSDACVWVAGRLGVGLGGGPRGVTYEVLVVSFVRVFVRSLRECYEAKYSSCCVRCEFSLLSTVVTFPATEAIPATSVWRGNEGAGVVATLDACSPRCLPPGRL